MNQEQVSNLMQHICAQNIVPDAYNEIDEVWTDGDRYLIILVHDANAWRKLEIVGALDFAASAPPFFEEHQALFHRSEFPTLVYARRQPKIEVRPAKEYDCCNSCLETEIGRLSCVTIGSWVFVLCKRCQDELITELSRKGKP